MSYELGLSSLHPGHIHRCSDPLLNIYISILRLIVPVLCWLTRPLMHPVYLSFLTTPIFTPKSLILQSDVESLLLKSSTRPISLRALTISARSIGLPSATVAEPASLSAFSFPSTL